MLSKISFAAALIAGAAAQATAPQYGQCGGQGWTGATVCPSGWTCTVSNPYYSQCLPGAATTTISVAPTIVPTTFPGTTQVPPTTTGGGGVTSIPSGTATAGPTGSTLLTGNLWIRADEDPEFHHYLQSAVSGQPGPAVLGDYTTAAQFQINNGQMEQQLPSGILYLHVNTSNAATSTYLATYFDTTPDTAGTFAFQGDGVTWTAPNIARQDTGAWLACGTGVPGAFINLGAYDYMTPAGCADETLNYYNGATPVD